MELLKTIRSLALVLLAIALPIEAAISPTFEIAPPRLGPAPGDRSAVTVVASSSQFLAVWNDVRDSSSPSRLWATRVSVDGAAQDGAGFSLGRSASTSSPLASIRCLAAASDGTDFVVISASGSDIRSALVTADGAHVQNAAVLPAAYSASLVWLGSEYALLYVPLTKAEAPIELSPLIRCLRLDRSGVPIGEAFDLCVTGAYVSSVAAVVASPAAVQIAWADGYDGRVHTQQVATADIVRGAFRPITIGYDQPRLSVAVYGVSIATNGNGFLLIWNEQSDAYARPLTANGSPAGNAISLGAATWGKSVAVDGTDYVIAIAGSGGKLVTIRVRNGVAAPEVTEATNADTREAAIASTGSVSLLCWKSAGYPREVMAQPYPLPPGSRAIVVSLGTPLQSVLRMVWRGDHYLAAWIDVADLGYLVYRRFDRNGAPLDAAPVALASTSFFTMASDGTNALVVWKDSSMSAAIIDAAGRATPPVQIPDISISAPFVVAWNGEEYVVVSTGWFGTGPWQAWSIRFGRDGVAKGGPALISTAVSGLLDTLIPINDRRYLLLYRRLGFCFPSCISPTYLEMTLLSADLRPSGAEVDLSDSLGPLFAWASAPAVAKRGEVALIAWGAMGEQGHSFIHAVRVSGDGSLLDPPPGFVVGEGAHVTGVTAAPAGWTVVGGAAAWDVAETRAVTPSNAWSFVPADTSTVPYNDAQPIAFLVPDGPRPLIVVQHPADEQHDVPYFVGTFPPPARVRAVRH